MPEWWSLLIYTKFVVFLMAKASKVVVKISFYSKMDFSLKITRIFTVLKTKEKFHPNVFKRQF